MDVRSSPGPGLPLGAELFPEGVRYRCWAPKAGRVQVEISGQTGQHLRTVELAPQGRGIFQGDDPNGAGGDRYRFRLDDGEPLPDPASRWQPEGVHGPSVVIDPAKFRWTDGAWRRPKFRDLVIYELHIGAFTEQGTFRAAIEKLGALRELGINAIELLPLADFNGDRNWGYDGVSWFAPSRVYGHPDDLRALVDAAHQAGLSVILDVVYNHFGPSGNYLHSFIGDYLDESAKTPWGGAIRYGHPDFLPLRKLVAANPRYWMREFHIDGFRLDATHAIVDDAPKHLLQELTDSIHESGGFAIAEDPRNDVRLVLPVAQGGFGFDGVWADDFHHTVRVANTHEREGYLGDFQGTLEEAIDTLQHGWHYRGQRSAASGELRGGPSQQAPPERFVHCISNHDQTGNHAFGARFSHRVPASARRAADTLLCLTPYTPMLFMGQEWAASTPFLFFTDHDAELGKLIIAGRREEFRSFAEFADPARLAKVPNPQATDTFQSSKLRWEEREQPEHAASLALYRAGLTLRASEPAFRPTSRESWSVAAAGIGVGLLRLSDALHHWLVVFDLVGGHAGSLRDEPLAKASSGAWEVMFGSNEERFGGSGRLAIDPHTLRADFKEAETLVLRCPSAG